MKVSHKESQTNPADANATKGVFTPKRDARRVGVNIRPATLPKWKPAMVIPTALDLSVRGNHLQSASLLGQTSMYSPIQRKKKIRLTNIGQAWDGISKHFVGRVLPCSARGSTYYARLQSSCADCNVVLSIFQYCVSGFIQLLYFKISRNEKISKIDWSI